MLLGFLIALSGVVAYTESVAVLDTVAEGVDLRHTFRLWNIGQDTLFLLKAEADCGCTVAEISDSSLAPGETARVVMVFHTKNFPGPFIRRLWVHTSDSARPVVTFTLQGYVKARPSPVLHLPKRWIRAGRLRVGEEKTLPVVVENQGVRDLLIREVVFKDSALSLITPLPLRIPPGKRDTLTFRIHARQKGLFQALVEIRSNDRYRPVQFVNIQARFYPEEEKNKSKQGGSP